jgi:type VI secretion system secreted protein Hcp
MAEPAYMSIQGEKQGNITSGCNTAESIGNNYKAEHADEFLVNAFEHIIRRPVDTQSGQPSGQRVHGAATIVKEFDKASPLMYQALCTGERLPSVVIKWYRTNMQGQLEHYFTHTFEDAVLTSCEPVMYDRQDKSNEMFTHLEKWKWTYRKVKWEHVVAGTNAEDDWRSPVEA